MELKTNRSSFITITIITFTIIGAIGLSSIFSRENRDTLLSIDDDRKVLSGYTKKILQENLNQLFSKSQQQFKQWQQKPNSIFPNMRIWIDDELFYPLRAQDDAGRNRLKWLIGRLGDEDSLAYMIAREKDVIWQERLKYLLNIYNIISDKGNQVLEDNIRNILKHKARNKLTAIKEIAFDVVFMMLAKDKLNLKHSFLSSYVYSGFEMDGMAHIDSLQNYVLHSIDSFNSKELNYLQEIIIQLSDQMSLPYDYFLRHMEVLWEEPVEGNNPPDCYNCIWQQQWYVQQDENFLYAIKLEINKHLLEITNKFIDQGILGKRDSIILGKLAKADIANVAINWEVETWKQARQQAHYDYYLKISVLVFMSILIVLLTVLLKRRYDIQQSEIDAKAEFISIITHELKTPLASMRLMSETISNRHSKKMSLMDYPKRIIDEIDGLTFLVETILSFNRIKSGSWQLLPEQMDIVDFINKLSSEYVCQKSKTITWNITTTVDDKNEDILLYVDSILIRLLFINLFRNSCHYNRQEEVTISIEVQQDELIKIVYRDNGYGIDCYEWDSVFKDFYQVGDQKAVSGSGIGLALCKKIMKLHGGDITISDSNMCGTTFVIEFANE